MKGLISFVGLKFEAYEKKKGLFILDGNETG